MKIHPEMRNAFVVFSRNGSWGACDVCPRDSNGMVYPEFCEFKDRTTDHQFGIEDLVRAHEQYLVLAELENS